MFDVKYHRMICDIWGDVQRKLKKKHLISIHFVLEYETMLLLDVMSMLLNVSKYIKHCMITHWP